MAGEDGPCVEYSGTRNADGYGVLAKPVNRSRLAHRAALAEKLGRPVEGVARHSCDNPPCINPDHLLEGTQADNINDAFERGRMRGGRAGQTHCVHGHEMTPENTLYYAKASTRKIVEARRCMTCRREANNKQAAARKDARHKRGLKRKAASA